MELIFAATAATNIILIPLAFWRVRADRVTELEAEAYRAGHEDGYFKAAETLGGVS